MWKVAGTWNIRHKDKSQSASESDDVSVERMRLQNVDRLTSERHESRRVDSDVPNDDCTKVVAGNDLVRIWMAPPNSVYLAALQEKIANTVDIRLTDIRLTALRLTEPSS